MVACYDLGFATRNGGRRGSIDVTLDRLQAIGGTAAIFVATCEGEPCIAKLPLVRSGESFAATWIHTSETFRTVDRDSHDGRDDGLALGADNHAALSLLSEAAALEQHGAAWNTGVVAVCAPAARGSLALPDDARHLADAVRPDGAMLILPLHDADPVAAFSALDRPQLWLACLPALWTALTGHPHGDLSPGNILVDRGRGRCRLIDPLAGSVCVSEDTSCIQPNSRVRFSCTSMFQCLSSPLGGTDGRILAFDAGEAEAYARATAGAEYVRRVRLGEADWRLKAPLGVGETVRPLPPGPTRSDREALGLLTFHFLTGETLFRPDVLQEPAWFERWRTPNLRRETPGERRVANAIADGFLRRRLMAIAAPAHARLVEGLVLGHIDSRDEIEDLVA